MEDQTDAGEGQAVKGNREEMATPFHTIYTQVNGLLKEDGSSLAEGSWTVAMRGFLSIWEASVKAIAWATGTDRIECGR